MHNSDLKKTYGIESVFNKSYEKLFARLREFFYINICICSIILIHDSGKAKLTNFFDNLIMEKLFNF